MKHIHTVVFIAALFLVSLLSGCVSPQAESDWRWQQTNPGWKPTIPADTAAQQWMHW